MRRLLYVTMVAFPLVAICYFIYPRPKPPPGTQLAQKSDIAKERRWKSDSRVPLGTKEFVQLVGTNVDNFNGELTTEQRSELANVLVAWSKAYNTNSFEDFLHFRKPSNIEVVGTSLAFDANWLKKWRSEQIEGLSPEQLLRKVYTYNSTLALTSVAKGSFQIQVRKVTDLTAGFLDPCFDMHGGTYLVLGQNSPCKYESNPNAILAQDKVILCARVAGGFFTSAANDVPIPVALYLYWAPSEATWRPMQLAYSSHVTSKGTNMDEKTKKVWSLYF